MTPASFVSILADREVGHGLANPWRSWVPEIDIGPEAPALRAGHLLSYLEQRVAGAEALIIAEAAGYQGARFSGLAMTCERTLLGGKAEIPSGSVLGAVRTTRTSSAIASRNEQERRQGFCEPTASIVWGELVQRPEASRKVVLWNIFPFHPHRPGAPLSNRTPTRGEVDANLDIIEALFELLPGREVVAVGEVSHRQLDRIGVAATAIRHPAYGGAPDFRRGMASFMDKLGWKPNRRDLFSGL